MDLAPSGLAGAKLQGSSAADDSQQEWVAKNIRERFSRHNLTVGLFLAAWGLLIGLRGQPGNLDKLLKAQPTLATLLTVLQWVTLVNGGILFLSGHGVRAGRLWGVYLAAASAVLSILAGGVFLGVFWHLGKFTGLENSVARVNFATTNLDLLVGLVDGLALLVFLTLYRPASSPE